MVHHQGGFFLCVCSWPSNQDDEADKNLPWLFKQVLSQKNLVIMDDFNYPGICWGNSTSMHKLSMRFLEYMRTCILLNVLVMLTRNNALLDLLLTNWKENFKWLPWMQQSQQHCGFKILLSIPKTSINKKALGFRWQLRSTQSPHVRDLIGSMHGKQSSMWVQGVFE